MARTEITNAVAEFPEPFTPLTFPFEWEQFARFPNYFAAQIIAGLFENEGVPTIIECCSIFPGVIGYASIWVPRPLAHRARWILALPPPTESELIFLATGELAQL